MSISIFEWSYTIALIPLGLDLKDRVGKAQLSRRLKALLGRNPPPQSVPTPANLQIYIDLYAEQVTADPVADIGKYFQNRAAQGFTVGGLPTGFPPLAILPSDVRPSNTAISAIGEGLVGWYMQQRGFQLLSRPIGEGPDFIFVGPGAPGARTVLVEVKGTQLSDVKGQMSDAAIPRLQYAKNVAIPGNAFSCCIVGVIIKGSGDFDLLNLEIELN